MGELKSISEETTLGLSGEENTRELIGLVTLVLADCELVGVFKLGGGEVTSDVCIAPFCPEEERSFGYRKRS